MFKNPGKKLKILAKVTFWLIVVSAIIIAIVGVIAVVATTAIRSRNAFSGLIIIATVFGGALYVGLSILLAWLASIRLYAVGQQIEDTAAIRERLEHLCQYPPVTPVVIQEKIAREATPVSSANPGTPAV